MCPGVVTVLSPTIVGLLPHHAGVVFCGIKGQHPLFMIPMRMIAHRGEMTFLPCLERVFKEIALRGTQLERVGAFGGFPHLPSFPTAAERWRVVNGEQHKPLTNFLTVHAPC